MQCTKLKGFQNLDVSLKFLEIPHQNSQTSASSVSALLHWMSMSKKICRYNGPMTQSNVSIRPLTFTL